MSMTTKSLLVELLVEELPPKALRNLGDTFAKDLYDSLKEFDLLEEASRPTAFASPRRLGVHITHVRSKSPERTGKKRLMPSAIAFTSDGSWSEVLQKRLAKDQISKMDIDRGDFILVKSVEGSTEYVFLEEKNEGNSLSWYLGLALIVALRYLPIPKVMTYQLADGWTDEKFVRPAHGLVALHGAEIVESVSALGLDAGRETQGHRFEASVNPVVLKDADSYAQQLGTEGAVIASFAARRAEIARQLAAAATKENLRPIADEALLDEVTALVERPNVLIGEFDATFLEVPQECLILTMKTNQKYFPLLDANGKLTNKFLIVSNIRPADASLVISGNERVLRARLADARFFFDQDRKKPLDSRVLGLAKVVYHNKLGSQGERVTRVQAIARAIGQQLRGDALALQADQAALLAKADLLTDMVSEFPELQGIMGRYYAQHDGVNDDIAYAIEDHYKPRFAGDELPRNMVGICVALADKLETLAGMFGIGQIPTGDKDPFALRRHALGVVRMLIEKELPLELGNLVETAFAIGSNPETYANHQKERMSLAMAEARPQALGIKVAATMTVMPGQANDAIKLSVMTFIYDRFSANLRDQGYSAQEVDAVLSLRPQLLVEVPKRLAAVRAFSALPEAAALAAANKRVGNILKKVEGNFSLRQAQGERFEIDTGLLQEPAEQALHQILSQIAPKAEAAFVAGDYTASLQALAALKEPVDTFFDKVMVNTEDAALRANRLTLLLRLQQAMNRVADISKLAT